MYFSKNSRYVLQKAQFLPPAFLKATEKNLSVKKPKDDPTKPALRVNIPDENPHTEDYSKLIRNSGVDSRSRSLMSRAKTSALDDGLLTKSESEIEFSKFSDILSKADFDRENKKYNFGVSKDEYTEALGASTNNPDLNKYSSVENTSGVKAPESSNENQEMVDPKGLYIIIDVPEKGEMTNEVSGENTQREEFIWKNLSSKIGESPKGEADNRQIENSVKKTKSLPHIRSNPIKPGSNRRFEVHETEDAATYIFHLRFNKNVRSRPSRVGCVPEKEITTRTEIQNYNDSPIKIRDIALGKDGEFPKFPETKKKPKLRKTETPNETKASLLAVNKSQSQQDTEHETESQQPTAQTEGESVDPQQKVLLEKVNHIMEEKKSLKRFERDDFDAVRSASAFKSPEVNIEKKQEFVQPEAPVEMSATSAPENEASDTTKVSPYAPEAHKQIPKQTESHSTPTKLVPDDWSASITTPVDSEALNNFTQYYQLNDSEPENEMQNPNEIQKMGNYPKFFIPPRRVSKDKYKSHSAHYLTIHEPEPGVDNQQEVVETPVEAEPESKYLNANEVHSSNKKNYRGVHDKKSEPERKNPKKHGKSVKSDNDSSDFQTSASYVSIGCEKVTSSSMTFSVAFPPLLREALNRRFKLKKDFLNEKWTKIQITPKDPQMYKVSELSENSILFPKKESERFDCEALLTSSEEIISNIIRSSQKETQKMSEATLSDSPKKTPVDSLTVMKQVKNIIQLDLDNVVKIFKDGKTENKDSVSSVVMLKGDEWKVDTEELEKQIELRKSEMKIADLVSSDPLHKSILGDKIDSLPLKYLPSKKINTEMKLTDDQSVITFNPTTNEFFINKEGLAEAISRRTTDSYTEITRTLDMLAEKNAKTLEAKSGDSILVFDEETQSWKVDFSILEKREQQLQLEEELTKRSELILETFEKFEKGQLSTVPKPDTTDKKTFDYRRKEWSAYTSNDSGKAKSPFRESNAEEIRKKNSDMYEDLFIAKKKETSLDNTGKHTPGPETSKTPKESKFYSLEEMKASSEGSSTPKSPEPSKPTPPLPPPVDGKEPPKNEEDGYWDSFLKMNILPRDIREITNVPPVTPPPGQGGSKIEDPKSKTPEKKIEEPKFKIHLPFIGDKKSEKPKPKKPPTSKGGPKIEGPQQKPQPSSKVTPENKKEPDVKAPPPSTPSPKDDPKTQKPPPTIGSPDKSTSLKEDSKPDSKVKTPPVTPPSEIKDPKPTGKPDKTASAADHYVSDKIIEISRNKTKNNETKIKTNKVETVKLNISADKRMPSKVTEINLNKKCEEKVKESPEEQQQSSIDAKKTEDDIKKNQQLHKNFEKYQTPFSDPEYEEKSMKIKSDIESNPNLKKLDNWNKTLVLHDIMKPPENIESWLKDETDKMATLLLKILQEATDGKPKKKQPLVKPKGGEKVPGKGNPYENIRKKQENVPENFLFRVRTVNLSLENEKKGKSEDIKVTVNPEQLKDIPVQSGKTAKPSKVVDAMKVPAVGKDALTSTSLPQQKLPQLPVNVEDLKTKLTQTALEAVVDSTLLPKEIPHPSKPPLEITEDIPGPELLKRISSTWKVFPVLGSQMTIFTLLRLFQLVNMGSSIFGSANPSKSRRCAFTKLFTKYGPIVNVQGPLSGNVILIHKPEHLNAVFEQDATIPVRSVFDSLEQSRRDAEEKFLTLGFYTDWTKPEWNELRKGTCDPLIKGCEKYLSTVEMAGDSLVSNIRRNRNGQNLVSEDFMEEIKKWSLEGLCTVLFEKSFGFLEGRTNTLTWIMEPDKLFMALEEATECLSKCERGFQTWRLMTTPSATGLGQAYRTISSILSKQLYQAEVNLRNKNGLIKDGIMRDLTAVESMLLNDGMTHEEIICNLVDILLIGTNAMNSALGFLLYNLAENVKVQHKLFTELKEALPNKTTRLDYNKLNSLKYLQACVKENLRLHMPVPVYYRQLQNDILLSNYIVPKGTYVVMDYRVSCLKEQIYDDPDKFIPERWLSDEKWMHEINPFAPIPFCHGPRAELTKRVVEMQLTSCLAKIIRNFQIEYHYGEIHGTETIITYPDKPLKLNFVERDS